MVCYKFESEDSQLAFVGSYTLRAMTKQCPVRWRGRADAAGVPTDSPVSHLTVRDPVMDRSTDREVKEQLLRHLEASGRAPSGEMT
jgi:hypothetical protein